MCLISIASIVDEVGPQCAGIGFLRREHGVEPDGARIEFRRKPDLRRETTRELSLAEPCAPRKRIDPEASAGAQHHPGRMGNYIERSSIGHPIVDPPFGNGDARFEIDRAEHSTAEAV